MAGRPAMVQGIVFVVVFVLILLVGDQTEYWLSIAGSIFGPLSEADSSTANAGAVDLIDWSGLATTHVADDDCREPAAWCAVNMPKKSLFGFGPPTDAARWKAARRLAARY